MRTAFSKGHVATRGVSYTTVYGTGVINKKEKQNRDLRILFYFTLFEPIIGI
jgi:hypothetical protein